MSISADSSLIAGGYSDSYIHVYNAQGKTIKQLKSGTKLSELEINDGFSFFFFPIGFF
jgi:hypothetical protein